MGTKIKFITENLYDNTILEYTDSDYKEDYTYNSAAFPSNPELVQYMSPENAKNILRSRALISNPLTSLVIKGQFLNIGAEGCKGPVVNAISLARHNIPATSSLTLTLWDIDAFQQGIDIGAGEYDTAYATKVVTIDAVGQSNAWGDAQWGCFGWGGVISLDELSPMNNVSTYWFENTEAQYFQIDIDNPAVTSYNISRIFIGEALELDYNISHGHSVVYMDPSSQVRTDGGSIRTSAKYRYKQLTFKMATISPADRDKLTSLFARSGVQKDFLVSVYPENENPYVEADYQMIAKFKKVPVMKELIGGYYTSTFVVEET